MTTHNKHIWQVILRDMEEEDGNAGHTENRVKV